MSVLTPLEQADLQWLFSSHPDSAFGMRSALGGQLERAQLGLGRPQSSPEFREAGAGDRLRVASLRKRLEAADRASPGAARVLAAYYGPQDPPVLPLHYRLGRVMLLTRAAGDASEEVLRRVDAEARKGDRESAAWMSAVRTEAERLVHDAELAFAATRPPPRPKGEREPRERRPQGAALYAGRTDEHRRGVFATPSAKRAARSR